MKELSRIASAVQASTTMAIDAMFKQMKADGVDVIGFGAGEPDFNTPDNIKAAGIAAIEQNITRYTPAAGTVELRQAVCGRMKADYGLEYKPSQVVVSSGAKHLVYLALRAVVNPGDEVIPVSYTHLQKGAVYMAREQAHRAGQILQHGDGQVRPAGKHRLQMLPVHRDQLARGDRHGGGDPWLPVKEGRLADELPAVVEGQGALIPVGRADKALHRSGEDIVKLRGLRVL